MNQTSSRDQDPKSASGTALMPGSSPHAAPPDIKGESHPLHRGRGGIVVVLIIALLASAGTRYWAEQRRHAAIPNLTGGSSRASLSNMNSFALGLLLGGLRGPLVMFLWVDSENQKTAKNLEDVDTEIEWIRLLQPEFDTVHIFEIWNKAYNISVQMASLANKYSVILGALDYAHNVDQEKPDDINIIAAMAQIYFDKLGGAAEKVYYRRRVREESKPHHTAGKLRRQDPGWRRVRMDAILDDHFRLLPNLIAPKPGRQRPANLPASQEWNTGAELQYLAKYDYFPDGVSPFALAYNYYKRAEVLQNTYKQRHAQLSEMVIDSRPALSLKNWLEEDWEQGRRREAQAFNLPVPEERADLEPLTENYKPDHPVTNRADAELAVFDYNRASHLVADAHAEYIRHMSTNPTNAGTYRSHLDELRAEQPMCAADRDYLSAILAAPAARPALLAKAKQEYQLAITYYQQLILKYYTDEPYLKHALPAGYGRVKTSDESGINELNAAQTAAAIIAAKEAAAKAGRPDSHGEDTAEYFGYIQRANARLSHIP